MSQFTNGYLHQHDFPVTSLYFAGFLVVVIGFRLFTLKQEGKAVNLSNLKAAFLINFIDRSSGRVNWRYTIQIFLRVCLLFYSYWGALLSIHYANRANINFGVISCCFIVSVVVNTAAGLVFFNERLNFKIATGILVTMAGIVWISLAKG